MKKYAYILILGSLLGLMSCGSGSTTTEQSDSVKEQVDSSAVSANDSTVAQIPSDSTASQK